ncbi:hypothetical protein CKO09_11795 [Chromatium weissei]|nr:hypothetical protein [Chromatium weissei]
MFSSIPIHLVLWLIPAFFAITGFAVLYYRIILPRHRGRVGEIAVDRALRRLFTEVKHDLIVPDGRGGLTQLDHLALTPAGLLVVETKNYRGLILGKEQDAKWTQVLRSTRHQFQNPLRQNYLHTQAIKALCPDVPIIGRVVFAGQARFPKGMPQGVSQLAQLSQDLADVQRGTVSEPLQQAWQTVLSHARIDAAARKEHMSGLRARHGGGRAGRVAVGLLGMAVVTAVGVWYWG